MSSSFLNAFVLHSKPYRETSALLDLLTPHGRFRAVLRGARTKVGTVARPFMPLEISLLGRGELKTIKQIEAIHSPYLLQGRNLFSGLYINELLVRLLPLEDAYPVLFTYYQQVLSALSVQVHIEPLLRGFEWNLLSELGYGFSLTTTGEGRAILPERFYIYKTDYGLEEIVFLQAGAFIGQDLLAIAEGNWHLSTTLLAAKRLMRQVLAIHLQGKPLVSRELFNY